MFDTTEKRMLESTSEILMEKFGVCNGSGEILFPENTGKTEIDFTDREQKKYTYQNGIGFYKYKVQNFEKLYLFLEEEDKDNCERILRLVASNLANGDSDGKKREQFFKNLLTGENNKKEAIRKNYIPADYKSQIITGYCVLFVKTDGIVSNTESVCEVIKNIFPEENGFETVETGEGEYAVIAFISEKNTYEDIRNSAEAVCETVLAETMTKVYVSLGSVVETVERLNESFEKAVKICRTGIEFGLVDKCFDSKNLGILSVIGNTDENVCREFMTETLGPITEDEKGNRELIDTMECFLKNNQNISETSRALYVHRNTLMYRIEKFNKLTGLDCTVFDDGIKIRIAIMIMKHLKKEER